MLKRMFERKLDVTLQKLPNKYQWTLHNLVGHPAMEVLYLLGFSRSADWIHRVTVPSDQYHETVPVNNSQLF